MAAWERFLEGGSHSSNVLRVLIDESWRRCRKQRVDPGQRSAPPPVEQTVLDGLKSCQGDLLKASGPIMACARDFLSETGAVMVLADTSGTILTMEGDGATLNSAEGIHLLPGATWSEQICGTNAIGTALAVGHPVQIHSAEHYCLGIKRWTCSATVIRHPNDGEILGVVDVSGLSESYNRQTLALVVTTASRIETRIAMQEMERRYRLLDAVMRRWSGSAAGLVLFDRRGCPIKANESALAAISALGGELDLAHPRRIPALAFDDTSDPSLPAHGSLPAWMRVEWIEPVIEGGRRLGSLLVLPLPRLGRATPGEQERRLSRPVQGKKAEKSAFAGIKTRDAGMCEVVRKAGQLARSRVTVLLLGETGVGKEEFAQGIHKASPFRDGPYVALNCGGLSRDLLASELFGYVEGAFTGARRGGLIGKVEAANGGTLFLDEVGELPLDLQPHLLRVLEHGEIYRLGETRPRKVNFRLIAATNRDLRKDVSEGRFRMDLYYRLAVASIRIPPLRDRRGDIKVLAEYFAARFCEMHKRTPCSLSDALLDRLAAYSWPGNVRELRNVIESMVLMGESECLDVDALPCELAGNPRMQVEEAGISPASAVRSMAEGECELIRQAISATGGNLTKAARELGIAKSTLYLKIKQYGLERDVTRVRSVAQ